MSEKQRPSPATTATDRQKTAVRGWLGTPWFARRGFGWGYRPATWQGWALTALFVACVLSASGMLRARHVDLFVATLVVLGIDYVIIAAMTSRAVGSSTVAEPTWSKLLAALGRPSWQRVDADPQPGPQSPGAQAARWMAQIEADLAARRISPNEAARRRRRIADAAHRAIRSLRD